MSSAVEQIEGTELLQRLGKTKTNSGLRFLANIAKAMEAEKS